MDRHRLVGLVLGSLVVLVSLGAGFDNVEARGGYSGRSGDGAAAFGAVLAWAWWLGIPALAAVGGWNIWSSYRHELAAPAAIGAVFGIGGVILMGHAAQWAFGTPYAWVGLVIAPVVSGIVAFGAMSLMAWACDRT